VSRAVSRLLQAAGPALFALLLLLGFAPPLAADSPGHPQDGIVDPADSATASPLPAVLSLKDRERYRQIFDLQADGRWGEADRLIARLEDRLLMGHVRYQRYMHPTDYRSSYPELRDWLSAYADHPGARRVYRLALRRRGGAAPPPRPEPAGGFGASSARMTAPDAMPAQRSAAERRQHRLFRQAFEHALRRGRAGHAEKRFWAIDRLDLLTPAESAQALGDLAESRFFDGETAKSLALARLAAQRAPYASWKALWYGGLAAWQAGRYATAYRFFAAMADIGGLPSNRAAGAAVWAGRAALAADRPEAYMPLLLRGAVDGRSFYGQIARAQLGLAGRHDWSLPGIGEADLAGLLTRPALRRIAALVEVGEDHRADEDMRLALRRADRRDWPVLGALAAALHLPASQIRLAQAMDTADAPMALEYPLPDWHPEEGYIVDRALVFAFIRQESKFAARARSHAGASGLMQVMPATASFLTGDRSLRWRRSRLYDPAFNLALGQKYIRHLAELSVVEGSLFKLAAAYNGGPGNLARWTRRIDTSGDPLLFVETIPLRETRHFVQHVMSNLWLYRARLGQPAPSLSAVAAGAWPLYSELDRHQEAPDRLASFGMPPQPLTETVNAGD